MEELIQKWHRDMEEFFTPYFNSYDDMVDFFGKVSEYDEIDRVPRRMMSQIYNFVTLANDIEKIRPARDPLRVFFLKTCLEAFVEILDVDKKDFYKSFANSISAEGQAYILNHFKLTGFQEWLKTPNTDKELEFDQSHDLTIEDFFELIKVVRDKVVHDGNYWEMQFFAHDENSTWIATLDTDELFLKKSYQYQCTVKKLRTYSFQTTLNYEKFIAYFVEACIRCVEQYMKKGNSL